MVQLKSSSSSSTTSRRSEGSVVTLALGILMGALIGYGLSSPAAVHSEEGMAMQSLNEARCCQQLAASRRSSQVTAPITTSDSGIVDDKNKGWKNIHVFYGNRNHLQEIKPFSQMQQDVIVAALLHHKRNGYFVDLAAHHATYISNTYVLERDWDWGGRKYNIITTW